MKNYFKSKDGSIVPFKKVILALPENESVRAYYGDIFGNEFIQCSKDQYNEYIKWLYRDDLPYTTIYQEKSKKEPKQTTLTAEQVKKLMKKFNVPKCNNCKNSQKITDACINCDEKNSELNPTDEFIIKVNEVLK